MLRSALVVAVPEASPIVDPWRELTCRDRPSVGVPAHVTLLFPFVPAPAVDDDVLGELGELFARGRSFDVAFRRTARFPETLYLAPEPAELFVSLTDAIVDRFPQYTPYAGEFDEVVPHLTVAHGGPDVLDRAAKVIDPALPLQATVREIVLLEEVEPDWGRWATRAIFPLGRQPCARGTRTCGVGRSVVLRFTPARVCERMPERVEGTVVLDLDLERVTALPVLDREDDRVVLRPPAQRDLDPVAAAVGKLTKLLLLRHLSPSRRCRDGPRPPPSKGERSPLLICSRSEVDCPGLVG